VVRRARVGETNSGGASSTGGETSSGGATSAGGVTKRGRRDEHGWSHRCGRTTSSGGTTKRGREQPLWEARPARGARVAAAGLVRLQWYVCRHDDQQGILVARAANMCAAGLHCSASKCVCDSGIVARVAVMAMFATMSPRDIRESAAFGGVCVQDPCAGNQICQNGACGLRVGAVLVYQHVFVNQTNRQQQLWWLRGRDARPRFPPSTAACTYGPVSRHACLGQTGASFQRCVRW